MDKEKKDLRKFMKLASLPLIFCIIILILISCKKNKEKLYKEFKSEEYGFAFQYPQDWNEITRDLPTKWALVDNDKNLILFIAGKAQNNNLLALGVTQALKDLYPDGTAKLNEENLNSVVKIVKLEQFNNRSWYTYGIKFPEKNVNSIVSGTLCGENEILFVMVSDYLPFDKNKGIYANILNTFDC